MTLNTPLLYSVSAFDPSYEHTFEFTFSGPQVVSNRAIITDNDTQTEVYNVKQDGLKLNHVLPANTLEAGHSYLIQVQVYDIDGNSSDLSSAVLFYCFTTPRFYFSNVNSGDTVSSANLELKLSYEQAETETLNEYKYYLYDITGEAIYASDSFYTESDMIHTIYGLENDCVYYVRSIGKTAHGMNIDTGMIEIIARYISYASNVAFKAENDSSTGCITLKIDIIAVDFEIENENYSIENGIVDLSDNTLTYMIDVENDFYMVLKAQQLPLGDFCWTTDKNIVLSIKNISDKYYAHLAVAGTSVGYNIFKAIDENYLSDDTIIVFQLYRKNNVYDLEITYE